MLVVVVVTALSLVVMFVLTVVMMMSAYRADIFLFLKLFKFCLERRHVVHSFKKLFSRKLFPRRGNDYRVGIETSDRIQTEFKLFFVNSRRVTENDALCFLYLVFIKLTKVLEIHFALLGVNYGSKRRYLTVGKLCRKHRFQYVAEFAYARRLYEYSVGSVFGINFVERLFEVAYEGTTYTTAVHLVDLYARFFEEAAVNAYISEFVFNEDYLLSFQSRGKKFFD